ncbi:peptidylprolyl isomerase [Erythrobacter sp.]|uniref:peptidylprolyl isomerase n=1 Tax=Erythrobacter sp. TaxID=1042 RepID=UPI001B2C83D3|nr:peptidylprolyl isomerase [Erythrobacter sp.]MBO6526095.1 SurA N-terminal domain-containing protein [Erythrobacter sp.]MBO6531169.1 SurA N-terminal domain-containing protein [Erythrobacter sp.]
MFQFFRNFFKTKLGLAIALAFLGLIALAFASADVSSTGTFGGIAGGDRVAVVGDEKISTSDLLRGANNSLDRVRQEQPTATMREFLRDGGLNSALEALINRAAIKAYADEHGIRAGDNLVNSEIRMIPAFRGPDGNFSEDTYRQALAQQRITDAQVREDLGIGLLSQQMLFPAGFGATVPDKLAYRYAQLFKERREGSIALLPAATYAPSGEPDAEVLRAFYDNNRDDFVRPERRTIRYATFDSAALGDRIEPTAAEIAARYERDAEQYAASETRDFTQLIVPTEAAANSIRQRVEGGAPFEQVAREAGLRAAQVVDVAREGLAAQASPAVAAAYFSAARGEMTRPARSPLGWHLARIDSIDSRPAQSLAQVRGEIADSLREEKRVRGLADLATEIEDQLADGATLAEVADEIDLELATVGPALANGRLFEDPQQTVPEVLQPALATAFQMDEEEPEIAPVNGGQTYLVYEVGDITPAAVAPYAEIEELVEARWRASEGMKAAQAAADRVIARLRNGDSIADALAAEDRRVPPAQSIDMTREDLARQRERRIPPPIALLFSMAEGTVKKLDAGGNAGFFVVKVDEIATDDIAQDDPLIAQAQRQMGPLLGDEYAEQLGLAMRQELGVSRNQTAIDAVRRQLTGN